MIRLPGRCGRWLARLEGVGAGLQSEVLRRDSGDMGDSVCHVVSVYKKAWVTVCGFNVGLPWFYYDLLWFNYGFTVGLLRFTKVL